MQVVVIKARDITYNVSWATLEEVDESKCKVLVVVGLLVEENEEVTKVALMCSDDKNDFNVWVNIPTSCVITCDVIKEIDWEVKNA